MEEYFYLHYLKCGICYKMYFDIQDIEHTFVFRICVLYIGYIAINLLFRATKYIYNTVQFVHLFL